MLILIVFRVQYNGLVCRVLKKTDLTLPGLFFPSDSEVNPHSLQTPLQGTWDLSKYSRPINSICSGDTRFVS